MTNESHRLNRGPVEGRKLLFSSDDEGRGKFMGFCMWKLSHFLSFMPAKVFVYSDGKRYRVCGRCANLVTPSKITRSGPPMEIKE
jgi:hypothetical protein